MSEHQNVHAAKLAVMEEVPYLQKRSSSELKYTFAGEADLIHKVRGSMIRHGLDLTPVSAALLNIGEVVSARGTKGSLMRFLFTFRLMHAASQTFIDIQTVGEAMDYGDKACNKCMTIAQKYALRMAFLIETGDDPDVVAHNRDAENGSWIETAVSRIEKCRDEKQLDDQLEKFRGRDPKTNEPLFTPDQLGELMVYGERHRSNLRERLSCSGG